MLKSLSEILEELSETTMLSLSPEKLYHATATKAHLKHYADSPTEAYHLHTDLVQQAKKLNMPDFVVKTHEHFADKAFDEMEKARKAKSA